MAIDTAGKRASMLNWAGGPPWIKPHPIPDGTIAEGDRHHLLGLYSGIDWATPFEVVLTGTTPIRQVLAAGLDIRQALTGTTPIRQTLVDTDVEI